MNILLLNNNPVVTKLVTLSAQKTGDELNVVANLDEITQNSCDVLIFDDALFSEELYAEVMAQITCKKKMYMGSRGTQKPDDFDIMVNKPFLPTDLVDLFTTLSKEVVNLQEEMPEFEVVDEELVLDEDHDNIEEELNLDEEELDLDLDEMNLDDAIESLDEELDLESLEDDLEVSELDDDIQDELEPLHEEERLEEGVLDKDELQEVQALLEDEELKQEGDDLAFEEDELLLDDFDLNIEDDANDETAVEEKDEALNLDDLEDEISLDELDLESDEMILDETITQEGIAPEESLQEIDEEVELNDVELTDEGLQELLEEEFDLGDLDLEEDENDIANDDEPNLDDLEIEEESSKTVEEDTLEDELEDLVQEENNVDIVDNDELELDDLEIQEVPEVVEEETLEDEVEDMIQEDSDVNTEEFEDEIVDEDMADEKIQLDETALEESDELDLLVEDEMVLETDDNLEEFEGTLESAVENLTQEELNTPVDEEMLLDMVSDDMDELENFESDISEFDGLDENDLRRALGEEEIALPDEASEEEPVIEADESQITEEPFVEEPLPEQEESIQSDVSDKGAKVVQELIASLQDKEVVAYLKEMNISINISFGDK
jgi:uncharacterized membrane protein